MRITVNKPTKQWASIRNVSLCGDFIRRVRKIAKSHYQFRHVCQDGHNSAPTGRIFMEFDIWGFFLNSFEKMQV